MKRLLPLAVAGLLLAGCASSPVVHTDYDPAATFATYRTYAWRQPPPVTNPLVRQRLIDAIEAQLASKGWTQVAEADADIALVGNVATHEEQTLDTFYGGPDWGGWGWQGVGGIAVSGRYRTTQIHSYTVGTLVLDMFDASTKRAIWRGTASGTVSDSPEKNQAAVEAALDKMLSAFPPGSVTKPQ